MGTKTSLARCDQPNSMREISKKHKAKPGKEELKKLWSSRIETTSDANEIEPESIRSKKD